MQKWKNSWHMENSYSDLRTSCKFKYHTTKFVVSNKSSCPSQELTCQSQITIVKSPAKLRSEKSNQSLTSSAH
jgi:hypothetical protein